MKTLVLVLFTMIVTVICVPLALTLGRFAIARKVLLWTDVKCDQFVEWCKS